MRHHPIPNALKRILMICAVLMFISAFVVVVFGKTVSDLNRQIKDLSEFLVEAEEAQPNFEKSLTIYTESTKEIISYVSLLRPDEEVDYITFISEVEDIGRALSLNLDLESIDPNEEDGETDMTGSNTLDYEVSFYGSMTNLIDFLRELESLNYFIKVDEIGYRSLDSLIEDDNALPNINLKIKLYVK